MIIARRGWIPLPYQQGQLDGLCGVYSIVNAVKLALGDRRHDYPAEAWQELFHALLLAADDSIGLPRAMAAGLETKALAKLLRVAVSHLRDEHELGLAVDAVLKRGERPPLITVLRRLHDLARQPGSAVIIALRSHLNHWSVVRSVGERYLILFDSSHYPHVQVANCRMSYEPRRPAGREHLLLPVDLFCLRLEPS